MARGLTTPWISRAPLAGLFVVSLGASLATMDIAVNVAFPSITAAFALETHAIRWLVICYVLTYSSLMLAFGKLGDRIGHRRVFRAGLAVSVLAYVLCALAPDYPALLAARILQGVASALVLSCAPALATQLFDESRRLSALARYGSLTALAGVAAPLIGGASIAALGWTGVFWFRAPLAALALLLLPLLPRLHEPHASADAREPNLTGAVLLAASLVFLLLTPALLYPTTFGWLALTTAVAGLAGLYAFAKHERRAADPIFPLDLVRAPDFIIPNLASVAVQFVAFAVPLLVPFYLTRMAGYTPLEGGALLALSPAGILIGSALAGKAVRMLNVRRAALLGGALVAGGSGAVALWSSMPGLPVILCTLIVHGIGVGLFQVAYTDIVVGALPPSERGVAGSLTMVTRTVGIMSAATALTASLYAIENTRRAGGASEAAAFADAFASVFACTALALVAFFAFSGLRRAMPQNTNYHKH